MEEIAKRVRGNNPKNSRWEALEKVADYYAEEALRQRDWEIEKRWNVDNRRVDRITPYKKKDRREMFNRGKRKADRDGRYIEYPREGTEEFVALAIYDLIGNGKKKRFLQRMYDEKTLKSQNFFGSYFRGERSGNNTYLMTMLLLKEEKDIALKSAMTLETIAKDDHRKNRIHNLSSFLMYVGMLYRLSGESHYRSFLARIKKSHPEAYDIMTSFEKPEEMFVLSGNPVGYKTMDERLQFGMTFEDKMRIAQMKILGAFNQIEKLKALSLKYGYSSILNGKAA